MGQGKPHSSKCSHAATSRWQDYETQGIDFMLLLS